MLSWNDFLISPEMEMSYGLFENHKNKFNAIFFYGLTSF